MGDTSVRVGVGEPREGLLTSSTAATFAQLMTSSTTASSMLKYGYARAFEEFSPTPESAQLPRWVFQNADISAKISRDSVANGEMK